MEFELTESTALYFEIIAKKALYEAANADTNLIILENTDIRVVKTSLTGGTTSSSDGAAGAVGSSSSAQRVHITYWQTATATPTVAPAAVYDGTEASLPAISGQWYSDPADVTGSGALYLAQNNSISADGSSTWSQSASWVLSQADSGTLPLARYSANRDGSAPVTAYVQGTHYYYQIRLGDGTWGEWLQLANAQVPDYLITNFAWSGGPARWRKDISPALDLRGFEFLRVRLRVLATDYATVYNEGNVFISAKDVGINGNVDYETITGIFYAHLADQGKMSFYRGQRDPRNNPTANVTGGSRVTFHYAAGVTQGNVIGHIDFDNGQSQAMLITVWGI